MNPRFGGTFFGINLMQAGTVAASVVANNLLAAQLQAAIAKSGATWASDPKIAPLLGVGSKLVVTIGGSFVLRKFVRQPGLANAWALGGGIAIALDLITAYVLPALHLSDYLPGNVSGYEQIGASSSYPDVEVSGTDNVYGDTIYG